MIKNIKPLDILILKKTLEDTLKEPFEITKDLKDESVSITINTNDSLLFETWMTNNNIFQLNTKQNNHIFKYSRIPTNIDKLTYSSLFHDQSPNPSTDPNIKTNKPSIYEKIK